MKAKTYFYGNGCPSLISHGKKPLRQQIRSVLRWTGWVLLVQFLLINISTAFYADKLTRFLYQSARRV
ncbi:MAG: hypothetical protein IPP99_15950 [Chitinophagaceae bacterium]|nr:hypothetical protein [Chitinophagaceae bacterium]